MLVFAIVETESFFFIERGFLFVCLFSPRNTITEIDLYLQNVYVLINTTFCNCRIW